MPNWGEHLAVANKLAKKIKEDKNLFLFANILPDIQAGYLVKGISNIQPRNIDHFDLKNGKWGYENFYDKYSKKLNNPVVLGYLTHLMTDYCWNSLFYDKKCIKENNQIVGYINKDGVLVKGERKKLREDKQKDFKEFQNYVYQNYEMQLPEISADIVSNVNIIENININDDDVKKVINYIKETKKDAQNKECELQIFTLEELIKQIDETVDFILEFLKDKNILN